MFRLFFAVFLVCSSTASNALELTNNLFHAKFSSLAPSPNLKNLLDKSLNFPAPQGRINAINVNDLFLIRSIEAQNLTSFAAMIRGVLGYEDEAQLLIEIEKTAYKQPEWGSSCYNKIVDILEKHQSEVKKLRSFYGSIITDPKFAVYFTEGEPAGRAIRTYGSIRLDNDLCSRPHESLGIIVHEYNHTLYSSQPKKLQISLAEGFQTHKTIFGQLTYEAFNEAVATAAGNGWFTKKISGGVPDGKWYSDSTINTFAKGLLPLVSHYMDNGMTMDRHFINLAIDIYSKTLPEAAENLDVHFKSIYVITGKGFSPGITLYKKMFPHFHISKINGLKDGSEKAMAALESLDRAIIMINPEQQKYSKKLSKNTRSFVALTNQKRPIFLIRAANLEDVGRAFEKMATFSKISQLDHETETTF